MSPPLENALINPDDNAACQSLYELLSGRTITESPNLPATAKACLDAFCDKNRPVPRRRWTGLVLARLVESFPDVVSRLRHEPDDLVRVGAVILGLDEAEDTRIIAGLIIRTGLSRGIKFTNFWPDEKAHTLATIFPRDAGPRWMKGFQDYLDALSGLALGGSTPQLAIMYPIAFCASDGYRWSMPDENVPILLIESQALTIIIPGSELHEISFVHIPKSSIWKVRCRPTDTYESQDKSIATPPWDVVLEFVPTPTTFTINCSDRSGSEFTIIMEHQDDAKECISSINEVLFAKAYSSENTAGSSASLHADLEEKSPNNDDPRGVSKGSIVEFDRSKRDGSMARGSQQVHQSVSDSIDKSNPNGSAKLGALPIVKKPLRSNENASNLKSSYADFEFPDNSPSVKRRALAKAKKQPTNRKGAATSHETIKVTNRSLAAQKPKSKSQEMIDTPHDVIGIDANGDGNLLSSEMPQDTGREVKPTSLPRASRPLQKQVTKLRRQQPDVFIIPQETQDNGQGVKRGIKRTRAKVITYKEESSSKEGGSGSDSDSEYATRKKPKKTHTQSLKSLVKREPLASSSTDVAGNGKARRSKASARPVQPLKGSLLSNLQSTSSAKGSQNPTAPKAAVQSATEQKGTTIDRRRLKTGTTIVQERKDLNLEAHILGKLNDAESDKESECIQIQATNTKDDLASKKRSSISPVPSTPQSKWAKLNHAEIETKEGVSEQPLLTNAPLRVLQDPSSPCGSRAHGSMQAPPRPAIEDTMRMISPRKQQRSAQSLKRSDERQTPIHQLGKRSHSAMSGNLELLSSNSKPTPAPPHAASVAISGHADRCQVTMEKELGKYKIEKSDPFRLNRRKFNNFTRRLTGDRTAMQISGAAKGSSQNHPIELGDSPSSLSSQALPATKGSPRMSNNHTGITQPVGMLQIQAPECTRRSRSRPVEGLTEMAAEACICPSHRGHQNRQQETDADNAEIAEMDGDTLIGFEEPRGTEINTSPMCFRSSPPPMEYSPSSHSSTSAEPEPKTDPPIPTSEAEEMEWEASLQPHQRDLKDQLLRVSNRVLRHIVNNESAVSDIATTYAKDGQHSLNLLWQKHEQEFDSMHKNVKQKRTKMSKASGTLLSKLRKQRQEIQDDDE